MMLYGVFANAHSVIELGIYKMRKHIVVLLITVFAVFSSLSLASASEEKLSDIERQYVILQTIHIINFYESVGEDDEKLFLLGKLEELAWDYPNLVDIHLGLLYENFGEVSGESEYFDEAVLWLGRALQRAENNTLERVRIEAIQALGRIFRVDSYLSSDLEKSNFYYCKLDRYQIGT